MENNRPVSDTGDIYSEMSKFIDSNGFKFDHKKEITIGEFEKALTEKIASLEAANKNLHKRVSILKRKIERNRDNITE